jgi:hypothetical protein
VCRGAAQGGGSRERHRRTRLPTRLASRTRRAYLTSLCRVSPTLPLPLPLPRLQGKGEFTMEYMKHAAVGGDVRRELIKKYEAERLAERK